MTPPLQLIAFATEWCSACKATKAPMERFLAKHPNVALTKITMEDEHERPDQVAAERANAYGVLSTPVFVLEHAIYGEMARADLALNESGFELLYEQACERVAWKEKVK